MAQMLGADPEVLDQVAAHFGVAAQRLDTLRNSLGAAIRHSPWQGHGADQFRAQWQSTYQRIIAEVAEALRAGQSKLGTNAQQQRQASAGAGGVIGGAAGVVIGAAPHPLAPSQLRWLYNRLPAVESGHAHLPAWLLAAYPGLAWATGAGHGEAASMREHSPAAQLAWWNSLSQDQRDALTLAHPDLVVAIAGLPAAAHAAAAKQFALEEQGRLAAEVAKESVAVAVHVASWEFKGEGSAELTRYQDGHATVTMHLEGGVGRQFGSTSEGASVDVTGGVDATYTFANQKQAEDFLRGFQGTVTNPAHAVQYLDDFSTNRIDRTVGVEVSGEAHVSVGGQQISVNGAASATYDLDTHDKTFAVDVSASDKIGGVSAGLDGRLSVTADSAGHVTTAHLSLTAQASDAASMKAIVHQLSGSDFTMEASASHGGEVVFNATVDPNDPAVQAALRQMLADPGSVSGMESLLRHSDATMQVNALTSAEVNYDAGGVVTVSTSSSDAVSVMTFAKPVDGPWVNVNAAGV